MAEKDYHDYVIKDGKFIGKFEEMYRDCDDPWTQSTQPNPYSRSAGITHIKKFNMKSVLECGCGLGYYSQWIYEETGIVPKGLDISETAVKKGRELFPHLDFNQYNLADGLSKFSDCDCVLFSEIMWYILDDLDTILADLQANFKGKYFMVNQVFYKGSQKYGTDYFTSREELIEYMPFELVSYTEATCSEDSTIETSVLFKI
jgi:SAM-dependent methyltransferase